MERSVQEKALSQAAAPMPQATMAPALGGQATDETGYEASPVRYVGDKTFVLHNGVWTDTLFDPDKLEPVPVSFGSDDYFALIAARPEWGRYFALGDHVIVVLDGTAYEVREGDAPPVEMPPAQVTPGGEAGKVTPVPGVEPGVVAPTPPAEPAADSPGNLFERIVQAILNIVEEIKQAFSK